MDLIVLYKMFNNLIDLDFEKFFVTNSHPNTHNLRRHKYQLTHPKLSNSSVRNNFFSYRIIKIWNKLPEDLLTSSSLYTFKINLNNLDLYKFYNSKLVKH